MSTKQKIVPLHDRVLVRLEKEDEMTTTKGGILIAKTAEKGDSLAQEGVVVAVGAGRTTDEGKIIPLTVKVGDMVLFSKYSSEKIARDGEHYAMVPEPNILAVIK